MNKKKVAFICVHNSCRSQIAEALGKHLASDVFKSINNMDYVLVGDYYIPDLKLPNEERPIGKYGRMYREYLKEHKPMRFNDLGSGWAALSLSCRTSFSMESGFLYPETPFPMSAKRTEIDLGMCWYFCR